MYTKLHMKYYNPSSSLVLLPSINKYPNPCASYQNSTSPPSHPPGPQTPAPQISDFARPLSPLKVVLWKHLLYQRSNTIWTRDFEKTYAARVAIGRFGVDSRRVETNFGTDSDLITPNLSRRAESALHNACKLELASDVPVDGRISFSGLATQAGMSTLQYTQIFRLLMSCFISCKLELWYEYGTHNRSNHWECVNNIWRVLGHGTLVSRLRAILYRAMFAFRIPKNPIINENVIYATKLYIKGQVMNGIHLMIWLCLLIIVLLEWKSSHQVDDRLISRDLRQTHL